MPRYKYFLISNPSSYKEKLSSRIQIQYEEFGEKRVEFNFLNKKFYCAFFAIDSGKFSQSIEFCSINNAIIVNEKKKKKLKSN